MCRQYYLRFYMPWQQHMLRFQQLRRNQYVLWYFHLRWGQYMHGQQHMYKQRHVLVSDGPGRL